MSRLLLTVVMCIAATAPAFGQNIKGHYVSKTDDAGTLYHTFPISLFEAPRIGELTFDITYKSGGDGMATINFTCEVGAMTPADSVCFSSGETRMAGAVKKIYIAPERKEWRHRYSFTTEVKALYTFFDPSATPQVELYGPEGTYLYQVKPSAWRSKAPVMEKIFKTIRINE